MKTLEIGKDYGAIMGLDSAKGCTAIYLGGITWRMSKPGATIERDSQVTTDNAVKYINEPAIHMGSM